MKKNKGITLIALIITIIVLLILAGITISLIIGDNGILNKASQAGKDYSEQAARERLELVLADLGTDKIINSEYNETTFIDDKLTKEGFIVSGDIVIVDGWQFEIDRSVPKIANSLGKGKQNPSITIVATSTTAADYTSSTIQVAITYPGVITSIVVGGETIPVPTPTNGVYTVTKTVTANRNYGILVKDENGDYKTASIKITDITEDMEIYNRADMEAFRDKVNSGRTFEGRTVRVMADIDLQGSSSNQWIPIGTNTVSFKGGFEGNYHTISNLYINSSENNLGLFKGLNGAKIEKLVLDNFYIHTSGSTIGSLAKSINNNTTISQIWVKNADLYATTGAGGVIAIVQNSTVEECITGGTVAIRIQTAQDWICGGIIGSMDGGARVRNCYNTAKVTGASNIGGIAGYIRGGELYNSYNIGNVSGMLMIGGIVAGIGYDNSGGVMTNCYIGDFVNVSASTNTEVGAMYAHLYTGNVSNCSSVGRETLKGYDTILGTEVWQKDTNINNGFPILKWQTNVK